MIQHGLKEKQKRKYKIKPQNNEKTHKRKGVKTFD